MTGTASSTETIKGALPNARIQKRQCAAFRRQFAFARSPHILRTPSGNTPVKCGS